MSQRIGNYATQANADQFLIRKDGFCLRYSSTLFFSYSFFFLLPCSHLMWKLSIHCWGSFVIIISFFRLLIFVFAFLLTTTTNESSRKTNRQLCSNARTFAATRPCGCVRAICDHMSTTLNTNYSIDNRIRFTIVRRVYEQFPSGTLIHTSTTNSALLSKCDIRRTL